MLHFLSDEFDIDLSEAELVEAVTAKEREETSQETEDAPPALSLSDCARFPKQAVGEIPEFGMQASAAISNFPFAKLALVNDLKEAGALLTSSLVVAAIAGDNEARAELGSSQIEVDPGYFAHPLEKV